MRVEWSQTALDDRTAIFDYLLERNAHAAVAMSEALVLAGDSLATFPLRGRPGLVTGTRELVIVLPYVLVYDVESGNDAVRILRIWHSAQNR